MGLAVYRCEDTWKLLLIGADDFISARHRMHNVVHVRYLPHLDGGFQFEKVQAGTTE